MLIKSTNLSKARLMNFYQVMTLTADYLAKEKPCSIETIASKC
jgi:hypothetical protein